MNKTMNKENEAANRPTLRERLYMTAHSRLCIGIVPVAATAFVCSLALLTWDGRPMNRILMMSALAAVLAGLSWTAGIFLSTKGVSDEEETDAVSFVSRMYRMPAWIRRAAGYLSLILCVVILFFMEIKGLATGEISLPYALFGILQKIFVIVACAVPIAISLKK